MNASIGRLMTAFGESGFFAERDPGGVCFRAGMVTTTIDILRDLWREVEAVAQALLDRETLSEGEIAELVEEASKDDGN